MGEQDNPDVVRRATHTADDHIYLHITFRMGAKMTFKSNAPVRTFGNFPLNTVFILKRLSKVRKKGVFFFFLPPETALCQCMSDVWYCFSSAFNEWV